MFLTWIIWLLSRYFFFYFFVYLILYNIFICLVFFVSFFSLRLIFHFYYIFFLSEVEIYLRIFCYITASNFVYFKWLSSIFWRNSYSFLIFLPFLFAILKASSYFSPYIDSYFYTVLCFYFYFLYHYIIICLCVQLNKIQIVRQIILVCLFIFF